MSCLKGSKYTTEEMVSNLREFVSCATEQQFSAGANWYNMTAGAGSEFAEAYGVSIEIAVGIIAALSPNNSWDTNIKDTNTVLNATKNGLSANDIKVSTYDRNKDKAMRIARGEEPLDVLSGEKVVSFYTNILAAHYGTLDKEVTVDMWALRAACGVFDARKVAISDGVYTRAREAYQILAKELGLVAKQLQAIVWVVIRDLTSGIRDALTHNHTLFCPNCFANHSYTVHEALSHD